MDDAKAKIMSFLARFLRNADLQDHDDIFALGFVNSLFAMELVAFVEKEFSITVGQEDLDFENFKTIDAIAALVDRKTTSGARTTS